MSIISKTDVVNIVRLGDINVLDEYFNYISTGIKCTYLTYMVEIGNKKTYFSSNDGWQNVFIKDGLINYCPIYKNAFIAVENKRYVFTAWDNVLHKKGDEQDVMDLRMSLGIAHGLGLAIKRDGIRESLVFAGHVNDSLFHEKIAKDSVLICNAIKMFRSVFKVENS